MCVDPNDDEDEQVRRLRALLEPVVRWDTKPDRRKTHEDAWARLNADGKVDLWEALRSAIETKFRAVICEQMSNEVTMKPIQPFSFMDYSHMLLELLDIFLKGLDDYIDILEHSFAKDEHEEHILDTSMRDSRSRTVQDFLDVILFLHAVPQRADGAWDALDHESDVTWFREHCKVYQDNTELMAFLCDCALVVLLVRDVPFAFHAAPEVDSMLRCYEPEWESDEAV
jgi:hypothetical protein